MGDRLLWRCRRGMRELDKLMEGWYLHHYADADETVQGTFRELLDEPDPDILAWLTQRQPVPAQYSDIIGVMRTLGHLATPS